jgi:hypothetical protein
MTFGVEYVVVGERSSSTANSNSTRTFSVIKGRRVRLGAGTTATIPQAVTVVVNGNAYWAPRLADTVRARLRAALRNLLEAVWYGEGEL